MRGDFDEDEYDVEPIEDSRRTQLLHLRAEMEQWLQGEGPHAHQPAPVHLWADQLAKVSTDAKVRAEELEPLVANTPTCPCCRRPLEYRGWTSREENSTWYCTPCTTHVTVSPLVPSEERKALVPTLSEVDPARRLVTLLTEALEPYLQHKSGCNALRCMKCGCSVYPSNQHLVWIGGETRLVHEAELGSCTCGLDQVKAKGSERGEAMKFGAEIKRLRDMRKQELSPGNALASLVAEQALIWASNPREGYTPPSDFLKWTMRVEMREKRKRR